MMNFDEAVRVLRTAGLTDFGASSRGKYPSRVLYARDGQSIIDLQVQYGDEHVAERIASAIETISRGESINAAKGPTP